MPRRKYRRLRKDKVRRPRPGDQSLFDHARELNTNLALVDEEPIPILSTRKNVPDPDAKPKRGKGKVIGWYEIVGARTKIWVHGASDDDACGTFRVSKFHTSRDAPPKPTGRFKR
ncbi:MAG TPA: hypothetical protein VMR75_04170, partial [Candidatus Saccharimonadales bacterium]|nr:hypothetical protein [Candidatus Saccharimonadales bacterium]